MDEPLSSLPHLGRMLADVGVDRFFAEYWQKRTLVSRLKAEDLAQILDVVGPLEIPRLCGMAREGTRAWLANEFVAHSVIPADASNAEELFGIGATLYFVNLSLDGLTGAIADFLGAPRQKLIASLFLSQAGGGAVPHFDKNENFTIQLTGTKQWLVGSTPAVPAPPDGYVLGQTIPPSLKHLLPRQYEQQLQRVPMEPGSLLYVPRGTIHTTTAGTQSWSLNLSYSPAMWLDLVLTGLQRQLLSSPRWRGTVTGIGGHASEAAKTDILPQLMEELRALVSDPRELEQLARQFLDHPNS